jgi:hypothetical protein
MYSPLSSFMRTPEQQRPSFISFSPSSNTSLSLGELQGSPPPAPLTTLTNAQDSSCTSTATDTDDDTDNASLSSNISEGSMNLVDTSKPHGSSQGSSQWNLLNSFSIPSSPSTDPSSEYFEPSTGTNDDSFQMNGIPIVSASQWPSTKLAMFHDEHPPTPTPNTQPMRKLSPEQANKSDTHSDSQSLSFSASTSTAATITNTRRVHFVEHPKRTLRKLITSQDVLRPPIRPKLKATPVNRKSCVSVENKARFLQNIHLPLESPSSLKPDYINSSYRQLVAIAPPPKSPLVRRDHAVINTAQTA